MLNTYITRFIVFILVCLLLTGCSQETTSKNIDDTKLLTIAPHGVYYEIFVRSFADSDGDGIGDLKGATDKLDYLDDLGIEGIWLMPISPSPSYHGYDVTDYKEINPDYGTLDDMKIFVEKAHEKGIKIIVDLVVNHTSNKHPWFQKALTGDSAYKDYYNWANDDTNALALGEWGQKVWHGSGNFVYEGIFWEGMPDLNFDHPAVREEMINNGQFWLEEIGVDGFRLDAAKHIYSPSIAKEPEEKNHQWWREFRTAMESIKSDVILVGEVWASTSVVGPYLERGLTSAFNFDLSSKILETVKSEKDAGIVSSLTRTREYFQKVSDGSFIDSIFITNHDMPRVMTELKGNEDHAKMAASLLLTLPGNPFIYYGEETGLLGPKPDEEIREPFIWKNNKDAPEQTTWQRIKHNQDFESKSAESQLDNENSLLNHYKKMIHTRRSNPILIEGEIEAAATKQTGMVIFKRTTGEDSLLIIHNLSAESKEFPLSEVEESFNEIHFQSNHDAVVNKKTIYTPAYSTLILSKSK